MASAISPLKNFGQIEAGGFYLEHGLPDEYYAFTDGEISLTVERNGGINSLCGLDIFRHNGKFYPDRCYKTPPIVLREGNRCGKRLLYGPGIQFISTNVSLGGKRGRNLFHFPQKLELYPFGFRSESDRFGHRLSYDLCIDGRSVLFSFTNAFPTRDLLVMTLNKDHIVSGKMRSMKNQWLDLIHDELRTPSFDPNTPFPDNFEMTLMWEFIGYDSETDVFRMEGQMAFSYGTKRVVAIIAGSKPLRIQETKTRYLLNYPWDKTHSMDEICICLSLAESKEEALRQSRQLTEKIDETIENKITTSAAYSRRAPRIKIEGISPAEEFSRTVGAYQRSMVLAETDKEACIRSAPHKYGFFPGVDQLFPAEAFLVMGDYTMAEKLERYMLNYPHNDRLDASAVTLIPSIDEMITYSGNRRFLKEAYPALKHLFQTSEKLTDEHTGLLRMHSYAVDDPKEIGIEGVLWSSCHNGLWYGACRSMENFAMIMGDTEIEVAAHSLGDKIAVHYMEIFFDNDKGYLYAAANPDTAKGISVYHNCATIGMNSPYCEYLFRTHLREIAEYQAYALYHPAGRSAVAFDDNAHEMWKNCIMRIFHLAHEVRTARAAGLGDEAFRITEGYMSIFERYKTLIETHNISGADGDIGQRANWMASCSRQVYGALIGGVIGIQWDMGGLGYVPCDMSGRMSISEFKFRNGVWNITVDGKGAYAEDLVIDGKPVAGTMKVPAVYFEDNQPHTLAITRSRLPFRRPTLLSAVGASITNLESGKDRLSFGVKNKAHATCKVYCPEKPFVTLAGREITFDWRKDTNVAWIDLVMEQEQTLLMKL